MLSVRRRQFERPRCADKQEGSLDSQFLVLILSPFHPLTGEQHPRTEERGSANIKPFPRFTSLYM